MQLKNRLNYTRKYEKMDMIVYVIASEILDCVCVSVAVMCYIVCLCVYAQVMEQMMSV